MVENKNQRSKREPQPRLGELLAVVAIGAGHVCIELAASVEASRIYNVVAGAGLLLYLICRAVTVPNLFRFWGFRVDNFWGALKLQSLFAVPAATALLLLGLRNGTVPLPWSFWLVCMLYPLFGVAQQFVLQNLIARNLIAVVREGVPHAMIAALLFSLAHIPRLSLTVLALINGFFLTLLYQRQPNLWVVGVVHGLLGALVFYVVLQRAPGETILSIFANYVSNLYDG